MAVPVNAREQLGKTGIPLFAALDRIRKDVIYGK
jgi:hypothetical protein